MAGSWIVFLNAAGHPMLFCEESGALIEEVRTDVMCKISTLAGDRDIRGGIEDLTLALGARRIP